MTIDTPPTRLLLAEDSFLVREGLRLLLEEAGHQVVGLADDYPTLLEAVTETTPAAVITDICMPPTHTDEGVRAARQIRAEYPDVGVVVLSQYAEPEYALKLFEEGSDGLAYLLKERVGDLEELQTAIAAVCRGRSFVDARVVDALVAGQRARRESRLDRLSEREAEVLGQLATGKSNAAIAEAIFLSERGVEKNINAIFTKLDLVPERESNRRVLAVLEYLAESG